MIDELLEKINKRHAFQVKDYAMKIFDAVNGKLFNYGPKERTYLETAALLHDLGYLRDKKSHHKHSLDMILESDLEDFSDNERKIIAHIARYHRSSFPDETRHKRFAALAPEQKEIIRNLSPILRLADGLDKPPKNLITGVEFETSDSSYNLYLRTVGFPLKLKMAELKKDLFEDVYKNPLKLICKRL